MKKTPIFLSVAQVLDLHRRLIQEFGGNIIVRDHGLLDAALAMPAAEFEGRFLHEDLAAMAAAYLFHLCNGHPFVDGNKRIAIAAAETFLLLNCMVLKASNPAVQALVFRVAGSEASKAEVVTFFRKYVRTDTVKRPV